MNNPYFSVQLQVPRSVQRFVSGMAVIALVLQMVVPALAASPTVGKAAASAAASPETTTGGDPIDLTTCTLYGYHDQSASDSQFFRMNLQTGVETHIGAIANGEDIEAIDTQPSTGTIYGFPDNGSDDSSAVLVTINRDTGARTFVANVSSDYELPGASFNPVTGELWASADTNDNLYTINLANGAPTLKLDASKTGEPQALAWNNAGTTLYVAYDDDVYTTNGTSALEYITTVDGEIEAMEFDELGNLLVDMHGNEHLYVLQGSILVDTYVDFADNDIETLTTACPIEQPKGSLRVTKVVDSGDAQPHAFGFRIADAGPYTFPANGDDEVVFANLEPGTYTVTEQLVAGYEQVSTTCDDVAVVSGQQASCVMHNRIIVQPVCQLEIIKSHDRQTAAPGDAITYRLDFANTGTGNCTGGGVKVKDVLDSHLTYVADSQTSSPNDVSFGYGATPGHQNGTLIWNAQTLTPGESGWVTFQATVGPVDDCQEIQIPNQGKIWSNETGWLDSNIVTTDVATRCPEAPQLTVIKHVVGGTNVAADFTMMVGGMAFAGSETGVTNTFDPGDYTVTETGPAGYTLTYSGDCNSQGQVTLANDEHKTCTLTNTRDQGRVKIVKVLNDQSDPSAWTFDVTGYGTMNHDQYATLDTGSYAVTEQGPAGYTLDHVEGICDTVEGKSFQLNVTANGGICTVYNTINKGSLTVTKVVDSGSALPEEFGFRIDDGAYTYPAAGQNSVLFDDLTPGTYTATETGPAGYHQVSTTCDNVSVAPDQDATCVIHNARDTGDITGTKFNDLNGNGTRDEGEPGLEGVQMALSTGAQTASGADGSFAFNDLPTGDYTVSETVPEGWVNTTPMSVDVTVVKDETASVTFGNQELPEGSPILVVDKTDSPDPVTVGQQLTYTIRWAVGGDATAENVTLTDPLDTHVSFVSASNSGTYDAGTRTVTWELGNQEPGSTGEVTLVVLVDESAVSSEGTVLVNTVTISADNATPAEDTEDTTVLGRIIGTKFNDLNGNGTRDAGEPAIEGWTIMLASACPTNFAAYDLVPSGQIDGSDLSAFAAAMGSNDMGKADLDKSASITQSDIDCFTDMLGANVNDPMIASTWTTQTDANGNYRFDVELGSYLVSEEQREGWMQTSEPAVYGPVAIASGQEVQDLDFGNFQLVDLTATKLLDADGTLDTTGDQTPAGDWTMQLWKGGVQIGADVQTAADGTATWTDLGPGAYTVKEVFDADAFEALTATEMTVALESGKNADVTFINTKRLPTVIVEKPELTIEKSVDVTTFVNPGDDVVYTVVIANVGNGTAHNVVLDDTLPDHLKFLSNNTQQHHWNLGDLAAGDEITVSYTVRVMVGTPAGTYDNLAVADSDDTPSVKDSVQIEVRVPQVIAEESKPELTIDKTVNVPFANPGSTVRYTVVVRNIGEAVAENVILNDTLPLGFTFVETGGQTRQWTLGDMLTGDTVTTSYDVKVATTVVPGTYPNLAVARADNHPPVTDLVNLDVRRGVVLAEQLPRTGGDLGQMLLTFGAAILTLLSMLVYSVRRWIANAANAVYALLISRKTSGINTLANFSQNTEAGQTSATAWSPDIR